MIKKDVNILLVDDDTVDQKAMKRALADAGIDNPVFVAGDGVEALDMLRGKKKALIGQPLVIVLDLNMTKMDGFEFLRELRLDPELKQSIVFVLTASDDAQAKKMAYDLNVQGYIAKISYAESFARAATMLKNYWKNPTAAPSGGGLGSRKKA